LAGAGPVCHHEWHHGPARHHPPTRGWQPHVILGVEDLENHNAIGRLASRSIEVELSRGPALNKTAASAHRPRPGLSDSPTREMSVVANKFEPILVRLNPRLLAAWQEGGTNSVNRSPSRNRTKDPDRALGRISKRMSHKGVVAWLPQPELKDGTSTHWDVDRLNSNQWVGL
jgi:hypothetical protein